MRKFLRYLDKHRTASNLFVLSVVVLLYMLISHLPQMSNALGTLYSYISVLVSGVILAYILQPLVSLFETKVFNWIKRPRIRRGLSVLITVLATLALIAFLFWALVPQLVSSAKTLVSNMDTYVSAFTKTLNDLNDRIPYINIDVGTLVSKWRTWIDKLIEWVTNNITNIINTSYKLGAGIVDAIISLTISIYVLLDRENLLRAVKRFFYAFMKKNTFRQFSSIMRSSDQILKGYLGGNILDAVIVGVTTFIFMVIFGMPNAGLIAVIIGVTNLIPTFGPIIGIIPSAFILLIIKPSSVIWFLIFVLVLQQIDGNLIKPVLFGNTAGIAPIWVLVSIIVFGRMFGLMGMLFGVPIFAILKLIFDAIVTGSIESRGLEDIYKPIEDEGPKRPSLFSKWVKPEKLVLRFGRFARHSEAGDGHSGDKPAGEKPAGSKHTGDKQTVDKQTNYKLTDENKD